MAVSRTLATSVAVLLVAFCCHTATAADSKSPVPNTKPAQQLSSVKEPRNIEEEYYNVPVHSVLGEKPTVPLSNGKVINSLSEFDIVYEGPATHTGDLNLTTPLFTASLAVTVNAVSGVSAEGDALVADGPYGMWSLDAEQRFFWMPVNSTKASVTIVGRADFPRQIIIRGKWGGSSPAVATLGRIATRGAMPRNFALNLKAPETCTYTWTTPDSGCNNVFSGTLVSEPSMAIRTNIGGFAYASLYQDSMAFNKYAEVTCIIDPESAKVEPCAATKAEPVKAKKSSKV